MSIEHRTKQQENFILGSLVAMAKEARWDKLHEIAAQDITECDLRIFLGDNHPGSNESLTKNCL